MKLIITNRPKNFQNSMVIETGLSDVHEMCITVMKMYYSKQNLLLFITVNLRISIMIFYKRSSEQNDLMKKQFFFRH